MSNDLVTNYSLMKSYVLFILGFVLYSLGGYFVAQNYLPSGTIDILLVTLWFLGLPCLAAVMSYYIGWHSKKSAIDYEPPVWEFQPIQMKIEETKSLVKTHNRSFSRLVAVGNFWFFFAPIGVILFLSFLPLYNFYENSWLEVYIPLLYVVGLDLIHLISVYGAWSSTSNAASNDFNLPHLREALKLASIQSKVPGVSHIRIVMEQAKTNEFSIYRSPRVVVRLRDIERDGYIETWSDELGAVSRKLVRLYLPDDKGEILWWWLSDDRIFRKYNEENQDGYYVRNPVPSRVKELGVKDIRLLMENASALLLLDWLNARGENESVIGILNELGVKYP